MAATSKTPEEWGAEFSQRRAHYKTFTRLLGHSVTQMLKNEGIEVAQIETRTKTRESFVEKISRKDKYKNPLDDITDLVGVRVILYDPADPVRVGAIIENEFLVDPDNSVQWSYERDPERLGYTSDHYVVRMSDARCEGADWQPFTGQRAEIQVRTVMQHAWAAVDHKISYKAPELPPRLRHKLLQLSALLGLADQEFGTLLAGGKEVRAEYEQSMSRGEYAVGLDALSLPAFLEATAVHWRWVETAIEVGYNQPKIDRLEIAGLLDTMKMVEIGELSDLERALAAAEKWGAAVLLEVLEVTLAGRSPGDPVAGIWAYSDNVLELLLLYGGGSPVAVERSKLRNDIQDAILQVRASRNDVE